MEPDRDLTGVANLIQSAFAEELDRNGQGMLREMRSMSRLGRCCGGSTSSASSSTSFSPVSSGWKGDKS